MVERILTPEWRADQEFTQYPFAPTVTLVNSDGLFIPESVFLDANFYPVGGTYGGYISKITVASEEITIQLGDNDTEALAFATFSQAAPGDVLKFVDSYGRPAGVIVSEASRLAAFQAWPIGEYLFTADMTEFVAAIYQPAPEIALRGIVLADGSVLTGDVWLLGDDGVILRKELVTTPDGITHPVIRVDVVGDPLFRRRLCTSLNLFQTPRFMKQLRISSADIDFTCTPGELGDFRITVSPAQAEKETLRIRTTPEGLVFEVVGTTIQ